jgi:hypothetical protein
MEFLIVLAVLLVVAFVVTGPLRREWRSRESAADDDTARVVAELEAARDAKYREIRDAELDHHTGKLSDDDFQAVDSSLRAEAVEILHRLDEARGDVGSAGPGAPTAEDELPAPDHSHRPSA